MKSIQLIKPYFVENRFIILLGTACLIAVDFLQLFIPRIIKWAVDDLTSFQIDLTGLLFYALYMAGVAVMIGIFRYVWRFCLIGTSRLIEEGLRNRLFFHIQTLSPSYFDKSRTGDLMAHATNDIQNIRMASGMGMVAVTDAIVLGIAAIGFMAYINVKLTILVLIPMPLIIFGTRFFGKKMHRLYGEVQSLFSDLTEVVRERFSGIRIIKAYNLEKNEVSGLVEISKKYARKNLGLVKVVGSFFPMMLFFSNLSLVAVIYFGGRQTIIKTITPGDFVAFISYIGLITWPMMAIGWVVNLVQRGKASLDRINNILETRPQIDDAIDAIPVKEIKNSMVFENVSFSYKQNALPALSEIDIKLEPGNIIGIVGSPGSGKTSLLSLIPRLYDVSDGRILFDDIDIRNIKTDDLRSMISFVPQEPFLFAGTIRENIAFNNKKITDSELIRVAGKASVDTTIKSFPNGFETIIGEKGIILSGGQKQRIALARALLQDTPVLILDDPISQVDMETGADIINTIRSLSTYKIIIITSHRLSAVRFADQIIVLDKGRIAESGTHIELMKYNRYYAKTFRLQEMEEEYNVS